MRFVDSAEERTAGDGGGCDGIHLASVFRNNQLACLASNNTLRGFVGVLEPSGNLVTQTRSLLVLQHFVAVDESFGVETDHDLLRTAKAVRFCLYRSAARDTVERRVVDGQAIDFLRLTDLRTGRQNSQDGLLLFGGFLRIDGLQGQDINTCQCACGYHRDDNQAENHILKCTF